MATKLAAALDNLDNLRSAINSEILENPTAPDRADNVAVKKTEVETVGAEANEVWRQRAFDWSTAFFVLLAAAAIFLPAVDVRKSEDCPGGRTSCGSDVIWAGWNDTNSALAWAAGTTLIALLGISILAQGRSRGGLVGIVVGADNRLSTSKFQVLMWTIAIVFTFFYFVFQLAFGGTSADFDSLNGEYLLLLGGPFAAAVLAKQAAVTRVGVSEQQVPALKPGVGDLVQDNAENGAVADIQFLLFNLVALSYFVTALAKSPTALPDLPDTLVGLTSLSALTYLGAKIVGNNLPVIDSVSIVGQGTTNDGKLRANTVVRILGRNFVPLNREEQEMQTVVLFGATEVMPTKVSDREVMVSTPVGLAPGAIEIRVRTSAGVVSEPSSPTLEFAQ
jgi:hypothetical protein